jgi:hypothetical protein
MSLISLAFNRTVGRPLYRAVGNGIANVLGATDRERATIVKAATVIGSIGAAVVTMDAVGAIDAFTSAADVADVTGTVDVASTAGDVHFGGYHDPSGHALTTPDVNGTSWDHEGNRFNVSGGTWEGQPDPSH